MIEIIRYTDEYKSTWDEFVKTSKQRLFMFKRNYMEYHSDRFKDHSLLFFDDDELIALLPLSEHETELRSHGGLTYGGFLTSNKMKQGIMNECIRCIVKYMLQNGFSTLLYKPIPHIYHLQPAEEDLYTLSLYDVTIKGIEASTVINLQEPIKMPKGRKAQISRAKREGVQIVTTDNKKDFDEFIDLENSILRSKHNTNAVHTSDELYYLKTQFPDNICLYEAIYEDSLVSGCVIYIYDDVVHTQYMAANDVARRIGALDLIIYSIIEEFRDKKRWLDFGISTENNGAFLNEGLISQKEGFGGRTNIYSKLMLNVR